MIFNKHLSSGEHTRRFLIDKCDEFGWEVREEEDSRVVKAMRCRDWHRVERTIALFEIKASALEGEGWIER